MQVGAVDAAGDDLHGRCGRGCERAARAEQGRDGGWEPGVEFAVSGTSSISGFVKKLWIWDIEMVGGIG
jgi:hypothetical protein